MIKKTFRNDFHGTKCTILVDREDMDLNEIWYLSENGVGKDGDRYKRKYRRLQRELCGCSDCSCGVVR
jgi:hypothetical protein